MHWPNGICDDPAFTDHIYLEGTCENVLGGVFSGGDGDECCTETAVPTNGGTLCQ
jgi:hypothetical protein